MTSVRVPRGESWVALGLVGLGGSIGTLFRYLLSEAIPTPDGIPIGILIINVVGAFLLGTFIGYLALRGTRDQREQRLRLFVATGLMGGFTTYSSFADDSALLFDQSRIAVAVLYIAATLVVGGIASWLGIMTGSSIGNKPQSATSASSPDEIQSGGGAA